VRLPIAPFVFILEGRNRNQFAQVEPDQRCHQNEVLATPPETAGIDGAIPAEAPVPRAVPFNSQLLIPFSFVRDRLWVWHHFCPVP
jgi:hypothetical protein